MLLRRTVRAVLVPLAPLVVLAAIPAAAPGALPVPDRRAVVAGPAPAAVTASTVAGRCDVDGDGVDDVLSADNQRPFSNAYVVFGDRWLGDTDLAGPFDGLRIVGAQGSPTAAVGCAGDVDRDGRDEVLVGSWQEDPNGRDNAGSVFVVLGRRGGAAIDLREPGFGGYRIDGAVANDRIGVERVSGAGDVNRDGRDDVLVGGNGAAGRGPNTGAAWVVFGRRGSAPVDLAALGAGGYRIAGAKSGDRAGFAVANAGDVNDDGRPDQLVGAYTAANERGTTAGEAYVVFGRRATDTVELAALGGGGITIRGAAGGDRLGIALSTAGDVNRDGRADVLVGADGIADRPGRAYVIYGRRAGTVDTAALGGAGYAIEGEAPGDNAGYAVAALPDLDGDRRPEALLGAYDAEPAGRAYIVFGRRRPAPVALAGLTPDRGILLAGGAPGDRFGRAVADLGDAFGRRSGAFAVGADAASPLARARAGQAELFALPHGDSDDSDSDSDD